jgi:hypothetical protein
VRGTGAAESWGEAKGDSGKDESWKRVGGVISGFFVREGRGWAVRGTVGSVFKPLGLIKISFLAKT